MDPYKTNMSKNESNSGFTGKSDFCPDPRFQLNHFTQLPVIIMCMVLLWHWKQVPIKNQIDVYRFANIVVEVFGMQILIFSAAR